MNFRTFYLIFWNMPGHVAYSPSAREGLPGMIRGAAGRCPSGLSAWDTRRNRRHPGKSHSALGYAAHSGLPGGIRDSPGVSLGTHGGSEGSRRKGFRSALGNTWRVPRVDPEGISGRLRRACGVAFGLTFGTRGMFRRKDRRVYFEGVSKGAFGEMASGWLPGQVALSERG